MTRLFDTLHTGDTAPSPYTESSFSYLERSGRSDFVVGRRRLERWFSDYPEVGRGELRARIRANDLQFHSVILELFIHELLHGLGHEIELHPELRGRKKGRPDWLVTGGSERFYGEASVVTDVSDVARSADTRLSDLLDQLNRIRSDEFFLALHIDEPISSQPPSSKIRAFVEKKLADCDPDEIKEQSTPEWSFNWDGGALSFSPIPKSPLQRGKSDDRLVGLVDHGVSRATLVDSIAEKIRGKAYRYGKLELPLVLFLSCPDPTWSDGQIYDAFNRAGVIGPEARWRGLSGVGILRYCLPWAFGKTELVLYLNPNSRFPCPSTLLTFDHAVLQRNGWSRRGGSVPQDYIRLT